MHFSTIAVFAVAAASVTAASSGSHYAVITTKTAQRSTLAAMTSCAIGAANCVAASSTAKLNSTYVAGANKKYAAGAVALAAGALLAL